MVSAALAERCKGQSTCSVCGAAELVRSEDVASAEQVCDGAEPEERAEWELLDAREFKYLNKSSTFTLPRVDNAEEYRVRRVRHCRIVLTGPVSLCRASCGVGELPPYKLGSIKLHSKVAAIIRQRSEVKHCRYPETTLRHGWIEVRLYLPWAATLTLTPSSNPSLDPHLRSICSRLVPTTRRRRGGR